MRRQKNPLEETSRALRRAARAARCLDGDRVAASLLSSALAGTPGPAREWKRPTADDLLSVRLAAEHGMGLQEFLALDPDELIELFWPTQPSPTED